MVPSDLAKTGEGASMQMFAVSNVLIADIGAPYTYVPGDKVRVFCLESEWDFQVYINNDDTNYWVVKANTLAGPYAVGMGVYQFVFKMNPPPKVGGVRLSIMEMKRLVN